VCVCVCVCEVKRGDSEGGRGRSLYTVNVGAYVIDVAFKGRWWS
jgi:hypothetical protein